MCRKGETREQKISYEKQSGLRKCIPVKNTPREQLKNG